MVITNIVANNISPKEHGICGEFTITLDDEICIHKVLVVNGSKGMFITFPNSKEVKLVNNSKRYTDLVHPTSKTVRQYIQNEVLLFYEKEIEKLSKG